MSLLALIETLREIQGYIAILAGAVSLAFVIVYAVVYGKHWNVRSGAWRYIIALNASIILMAFSTAALVTNPGVELFHMVRLVALVLFTGAVAGQFALLRK